MLGTSILYFGIARLLQLDQRALRQYGIGDLLSRGTSDFIYVWRFFSAGFQMSAHALFLLGIGCALMAWYMMARIILNELYGRELLPAGKAWVAAPAAAKARVNAEIGAGVAAAANAR